MNHEADDKPQSLTKPKIDKLYHCTLRPLLEKNSSWFCFNFKILTSSNVLDLNHITLIFWLGKSIRSIKYVNKRRGSLAKIKEDIEVRTKNSNRLLRKIKRGRPWLSPYANRLDCLLKAREAPIVLKTMKIDDHDSLRVPTDLHIFGRQGRLQ